MSVTGDEPMDEPHGDDAAPADQPEAKDDNVAEAVDPNASSDADRSSVGQRPDLADPPDPDPPDPEATAEFRAAIEPQ